MLTSSHGTQIQQTIQKRRLIAPDFIKNKLGLLFVSLISHFRQGQMEY